jgi:hypothetical protein
MKIKIKDGGAAFPHQAQNWDSDCGCYVKNLNYERGITIRDWFAGQALTKASQGSSRTADDIAKRAYYIADAMLIARKAPSGLED